MVMVQALRVAFPVGAEGLPRWFFAAAGGPRVVVASLAWRLAWDSGFGLSVQGTSEGTRLPDSCQSCVEPIINVPSVYTSTPDHPGWKMFLPDHVINAVFCMTLPYHNRSHPVTA